MKLNRKNLRKMILKEMSSMVAGPPVPMHTPMLDTELLAQGHGQLVNFCEAIKKLGVPSMRALKGGRGSIELMNLLKSCDNYLSNVGQVLSSYAKVDPANRGADVHLKEEAFIRDSLLRIQDSLGVAGQAARQSMIVRNIFQKLQTKGALDVALNIIEDVLKPKNAGSM